MTDHIISLIDMDCFYVQVEQRLDPSLRGKPCAVVQYNNWKGGAIIAVSYEARDRGVSRFHRGDEAKKLCPDIELVRVPEGNGKADLTKYRTAGQEVIEVISQFAKCVERASVDEAYIDLTEEVKAKMELPGAGITPEQLPSTFVVGCHTDAENAEPERLSALGTWLDNVYATEALDPLLEDSRRLVVAAAIVEEIRVAIFVQTGFRCSAGIAHNKMLSKLACGLHKPNRQTILPQHSVAQLFTTLPLHKVRNLGGKLGTALMEELGCQTMADIAKLSKEELQRHFGEKTGSWLFELVRGIDNEVVKARQLPLSIGCSKNFPGLQALASCTQVKLWLGRLATELEERLAKDREANNRIAKSLSVSVHLHGSKAGVSRTCGITTYSTERFVESTYAVLDKLNETSGKDSWSPPIVSMGMSASKFQDFSNTSATFLQNFMKLSPSNTAEKGPLEADQSPTKQSGESDDSSGARSEKSHGKPDRPLGFFATRFRERMAAAASPEKQVGQEPRKVECTRLDFASSIRMADAVRHCPDVPKPDGLLPNGPTVQTLSADAPGGSRATKTSPSKPNLTNCTSVHLRTGAVKPAVPRANSAFSKTALDVDKVDQEVLACLPSDIQAEIRLELGKKNPAARASPTKAGISGYFKPEPAVSDARAGPSSGSPDAEDVGLEQHRLACPKCGQKVFVWDKQEHDDYHVALELQAMDDEAIRKPLGGPERSPPKKGTGQVKRKKQPGRPKKETPEKGKKLRSITSFFKSEGASHAD